MNRYAFEKPLTIQTDKEGFENKYNEICSDLLCKIANFVHEYRKANGLTNKQLADELGITTSLVSRIESGNKNISIKTISKVLARMDANMIIEYNR